MKIGIDARLIYETGVGRYIHNLLFHLSNIDKENTYVVYLKKGNELPFKLENPRWSIEYIRSKWHTIYEQIEFPILLSKAKLDLFHVPYFTVPLVYSGKIVTTLHDLTILQMNTGKATTLPFPLYYLKRVGYKLVLERGLKKARHIIAVSKTTHNDLINTFTIKRPISVIYEGVDDLFFSRLNTKNRLLDGKPFILYVGNAYPHKNVRILIEVAKQLKNSSKNGSLPQCNIVMIGPDDYFYQQFKVEVKKQSVSDMFSFPKGVCDEQLIEYFHSSHVTISPSKKEGFALPLLEALACDCCIVASDIPVFRELLPASVQFVKPNDVSLWAEVCTQIVKQNKRSFWNSETEKNNFFKHFKWENMAKETLNVYKSVVNNN